MSRTYPHNSLPRSPSSMKPSERNTSQKLSPVASTETRTSFRSSVRGGSGLTSGLSNTPLRLGASTHDDSSGKDRRLSGSGTDQPCRSSASRAVGDMVFRVGIQQVVHEVRQLYSRARIQIDHSRLEVGRFKSHDLAHAPQNCAGKLARAFAFQYLRPARDEPHAVLWRHI